MRGRALNFSSKALTHTLRARVWVEAALVGSKHEDARKYGELIGGMSSKGFENSLYDGCALAYVAKTFPAPPDQPSGPPARVFFVRLRLKVAT